MGSTELIQSAVQSPFPFSLPPKSSSLPGWEEAGDGGREEVLRQTLSWSSEPKFSGWHGYTPTVAAPLASLLHSFLLGHSQKSKS